MYVFVIKVESNFSLGTSEENQNRGAQKPCLAACQDQLNLVTETASSFPNSQTFHRREEFCLTVYKLIKTCSTVKAAALTDAFPTICAHLSFIPKHKKQNLNGICPKGVWNPEVRKR